MDILHDEKNGKFYCIIEWKECVVDYYLEGKTIDFFHTYVPQSLRGRGIARKLYDHISEWLKEMDSQGKKLTVKTSCSYAEKYFRENRQ